MAQSQKLVAGSLTLCLLSSMGCAGTGLRNMFSRNETEGYKSLAELEAEEVKREAEGKDADSQGPRFASWLPFGKKSTDTSEAVASTDAEKELDEASKEGWWRNPFRKDEPVDSDPFLIHDQPEEELAKKEKTTDRKKREAIASTESDSKSRRDEDSTSAKDASVKAVSKTKKSVTSEDAGSGTEDEDSLLVEKFEKHFQQNTAEAVDAVDSAEPLIVAGKNKSKASIETAGSELERSTAATSSAAKDKLAELERLLAEKKTLTAKKIDAQKNDVVTKKDDAIAEKSAKANEVSDAFFETISGPKESVAKANSTFDSLFGDAAGNNVVASKATSGSKAKSSTAPTRDSSEMNVANADALFGLSPAIKSAKPGSASVSRNAENRPQAGGWSGSDESKDEFNWTQSHLDSKDPSGAFAKHTVSREEQFASAFAAARKSEPVPPATLKDTPEPGSGSLDLQGRQNKVAGAVKSAPRRNTVRAVSATRELTASAPGASRTGGDEPLSKPAPTPIVASASAPIEESERNDSSAGVNLSPAASSKTWLLIVCGIIVAALLFAPARKKPIQAMHSAV